MHLRGTVSKEAGMASGARTSQQVSDACGARSDCGRCRRPIRAMIESASSKTESGRRSTV
nr:(2Fe-2S)-binding protein [Mycolicibacterium holsaticum]